MQSSQAVVGARPVLTAKADINEGPLLTHQDKQARGGLKRSASQAELDNPHFRPRLYWQAETPLQATKQPSHQHSLQAQAVRMPPVPGLGPLSRTGLPITEAEEPHIPFGGEPVPGSDTPPSPVSSSDLNSLQGGSLFPFRIFEPNPLGPDETLYSTDFDQLVQTLAHRRLSDPLRNATPPLLLQSWLGTGSEDMPPLEPSYSQNPLNTSNPFHVPDSRFTLNSLNLPNPINLKHHEPDLRIHRTSFPSANELLFPPKPLAAVSRFVPVSGWESSGLETLAPSPVSTKKLTLPLLTEELGAAQKQRKPLGELDANILREGPSQPRSTKKRRRGSRASSSDGLKPSRSGTGASASDTNLGNKEDQHWLTAFHYELDRAADLADVEARQRQKLIQLGIGINPNGHFAIPYTSRGAERSLRAVGEGKTCSISDGGRFLEDSLDREADERPKAFLGMFTSKGLKIHTVAEPREESLGEYLQRRVARASQTFADSIWRVHGKRLLTLGPSPVQQTEEGMCIGIENEQGLELSIAYADRPESFDW